MSKLSQYKRIAIIGGASTGKSTLAANISKKLDIPHVILDHYYWHKNWTRAEETVFLHTVQEILNKQQWIVEGNYPIISSLLEKKAECVIWLDYPLWRIMWRFFKRSWKELVLKKPNLSCCKDSFTRRFFSKDAHFWWIITHYHKRRKIYLQIQKSLVQAGVSVIHIQTIQQKNELLS